MQLLYTPNSPYARKVRIVALEKRVELTLVEVVLGAPESPLTQHNPLGKIPALILDNGDCLYDSSVIAEFLDNRTPLANLLPQDHGARIQVLRWQALADGVCDAGIAVMIEKRRAEDKQDAGYMAKHMSKVERGLKALDKDLSDKQYCVNNAFSFADIAVASMFGWFNLRFAELNLDKNYKHLAKHYAAMMQRESLAQTAPS